MKRNKLSTNAKLLKTIKQELVNKNQQAEIFVQKQKVISTQQANNDAASNPFSLNQFPEYEEFIEKGDVVLKKMEEKKEQAVPVHQNTQGIQF